jgi:hypothetical protein
MKLSLSTLIIFNALLVGWYFETLGGIFVSCLLGDILSFYEVLGEAYVKLLALKGLSL